MGSQPQKPQRPQVSQTVVIQSQRAPVQRVQSSQLLYSNTFPNGPISQSQPFPPYPQQYPMPNIPPAIPQQPPMQQRAHPTPQIKPKVIVNEVCVDKVQLVNDRIQYNVYADAPCKIQLFVQCLEQQNTLNQSSKGISEKQLYDEIIIDAVPTKNQQCISQISVTQEILSQNISKLGQKFWKLILLISSAKMMMIYYYDYEDAHLKLQKQKYESQQYGVYEVQEIYGINDSNLVGSFKHQDADGDCIICLSDKIDTIVMPCRHMCLCGGCAKRIMDKKEELKRQPPQHNAPDYNKCPICREDMENFIKLSRVG